MNSSQTLPEPSGHPYLQTLRMAGLPADSLLAEAEGLGYRDEDLVLFAQSLIRGPQEGPPYWGAHCLVLAVAKAWRGLLGTMRERFQGLEAQLAMGDFPAHFEESLKPRNLEELALRAARRLGYPASILGMRSAGANPPGVLAWLDGGNRVNLETLELSEFKSVASRWIEPGIEHLILRRGEGPQAIELPRLNDDFFYRSDSIRLVTVSRLESLCGLRTLQSMEVMDCKDLKQIEGALPPVTRLHRCPKVESLPSITESLLLDLDGLPWLRSLEAQSDMDPYHRGDRQPRFGAIRLSNCPRLRELPSRLVASDYVLFRKLGVIERWPLDFQVGRDFTLWDCPQIEELPPIEVGGSLRIKGRSGLRRIAPGCSIEGDLDLRACAKLERFPRDLSVRGRILLPPHLQAPATWTEPLLLEVDHEMSTGIREVILATRFGDLLPPEHRLSARERAGALCQDLGRKLRDRPSLESEILWAAEEAWTQFIVERFRLSTGHGPDWGEVLDPFPVGWFRSLLLSH